MSKKEKLQWVLIGVIILVTAVFLLVRNRDTKEDTRVWITRPESGTKKEAVAFRLEETSEEWTLEVASRERTEEERNEAFSETVRILNKFFGIEKEESAMLSDSVELPQSVPETGVDIRWSSSDDTVITRDGMLHREQLKEAREVYLQARMSYGSEEREHWFAVKVLPYEEGSKEALLYGAREELRVLEQKTVGEAGFYLPETIGPVAVGRPEEPGVPWGILGVGILFVPFVVMFSKRQEKEKERKRREEELLTEYPRLITKLTLYTGAGMSLRGSFERLGAEYRAKAEKAGKRNAIAEEILVLVGELKNGTSESRAYEAFGRRIGLKPYLRCASLLVSQLQKGSGGLRKNLENEVRLAWEMHRERAAKKGEEGQTKLLFPMMGMLFLVMAVVMIPAFFSM